MDTPSKKWIFAEKCSLNMSLLKMPGCRWKEAILWSSTVFGLLDSLKRQGNGKKLLQQCMKDAEKMDGVVAISSDKKRPFMSDPKFLKYQGFEIIDEAPPFFKLWGLKTNPKAAYPMIMESAKLGNCADKKGITAYYSNTCPFTDYYTNRMLREYANKHKIPLTIHHTKMQGRRT